MAFGDRNVEFGLELPNVLSPLVFLSDYIHLFLENIPSLMVLLNLIHTPIRVLFNFGPFYASVSPCVLSSLRPGTMTYFDMQSRMGVLN